MKFKELQAGHPVHILDSKAITLTSSKVKEVSRPYADPVKPTPGNLMTAPQMVVDVILDSSTYPKPFTIPEDLSLAHFDDIVLATEQDGVLSELRKICAEKERVIASVPDCEKALTKARDLMADIDPSLKEKQETERRLSSMETSLREMQEMMRSLMKKD